MKYSKFVGITIGLHDVIIFFFITFLIFFIYTDLIPCDLR